MRTVEKDLYALELLKTINEYRETIIIRFFIVRYAKLRMLELFYNLLDKFYEIIKFEE